MESFFYEEVNLFSLKDSDFIMKYSLLSIFWSKLLQFAKAKINVLDDHIYLQASTNTEESLVIIKTYLDDVRNVFSKM